ncbi:hypothetical protein [Streptomyces sp. AK02-01A]|uniref:hypothetical protein n=1 Tax=Streptomyces sp. AK02-01A TaxID=3028648 RepID=UPI0029C9DB2E|nr:hypothetical protein [Streptomyces sp. AK02-01A]
MAGRATRLGLVTGALRPPLMYGLSHDRFYLGVLPVLVRRPPRVPSPFVPAVSVVVGMAEVAAGILSGTI